MTAPWSGPGRALQAHLDLFELSQREQPYLLGARRGERLVNSVRMAQWLLFARTYSRRVVTVGADGRPAGIEPAPLADGGMYDGRTNSSMSLDSIPLSDPHVQRTAMQMFATEYDLLDQATTHYISAVMVHLVTEAAELAENEPIFPTDMPTPSGLLVLEEPLILPDLHPNTGEILPEPILPMRAIGWHSKKIMNNTGTAQIDGIVLIAYVDADTYNEIYHTRISALLPGESHEMANHADGMLAFEFNPWGFGTEWNQTDSVADTDGVTIISSVAVMRRWFLAFARLMWQRLLRPEPWHPDRAARRRYERVHHSEPPEAAVLHVRRFVDDNRARGEADPDAWLNWPYLYRIPVRAHWRRQHFATLGPARLDDGSWNADSHRLVFIARHARGPEHLPIAERHDITAVVR